MTRDSSPLLRPCDAVSPHLLRQSPNQQRRQRQQPQRTKPAAKTSILTGSSFFLRFFSLHKAFSSPPCADHRRQDAQKRSSDGEGTRRQMMKKPCHMASPWRDALFRNVPQFPRGDESNTGMERTPAHWMTESSGSRLSFFLRASRGRRGKGGRYRLCVFCRGRN